MTTPLSARPFGRRTLLGAAGAGSLAALAGCSSTHHSTPRTATELKLPDYVAPPVLKGGIVSKVEGMPTTYTTPIESYTDTVDQVPVSGGKVTTFQVLWGSPPQALPKNKYWADLNRRLGASYTPTLASFDTYNDKLATTIASGDVPDLTFVQDQNAIGAKAIDDGVFADLSDVLGGEGVKQWPHLANVGTNAWKASAKNGHIFGVPNENPYLTNFPGLRWDLMKLAGHDTLPADTDGFLDMLTGIAKLKKAHGKEVWAIGAFDGEIQTVVQWMFRAGTTWQVDDAGKVVNIIETDTYEQVLEYLATMWKAGVFHPDALALATQPAKVNDMFDHGQLAFTYDSYQGFLDSGIYWKAGRSTKGAEVRLFVPPAVDGGKLVIERDAGYWGFVAVSAKAAKDDKRLTELLNVANYWRSPEGSTEELFITTGLKGYNYKFGKNNEIVDLGDKQANANRAALQWLGCFASPSYRLTGHKLQYLDNFRTTVEKLISYTVPSPVVGLYNKAQVEKGAKLSSIDTDYRGAIVSGRKPLSALKDYRTAWRQAGGDAVRKEYQTALDKHS